MVKFMEKYIKEGKCRVSGGVEILRNAFAEISVVDKMCLWDKGAVLWQNFNAVGPWVSTWVSVYTICYLCYLELRIGHISKPRVRT